MTAEERAQAKEFGIPSMEYDGVAEVWLDSLDDWRAIVTDTDFVKSVARTWSPPPSEAETSQN